MSAPPPTFRELTTDVDLATVHPLLLQLRPRLPAVGEFISLVRTQQIDGGYVLLAGFAPELVVAAGVRPQRTLSRGPHLFVDDLVTDAAARGRGYGTAMLRHVARYAADRGLARIWLDSRDTARSFYERIGFAMYTAIPCAIDVDRLP